MLYASQYPTIQTISSQIKRNCVGRLCFVLDTGTASKVVIDQEGAEKLPLVQGRAIYKKVQCTEIQTHYIKNDVINRIISPHITITPRKDDPDEKGGTEGATALRNMFIIEPTELS